MKAWLRHVVSGEFNSGSLRSLLRLYYKEDRVYTIPFGVTRGLKMMYNRTVNFHAILGLWDTRIFRFLSEVLVANGLLPNDSVICDGGANIGVYALWFGRVASNGKVYSFEPNPEARSIVAKNVQLNKMDNVIVEDQALSGQTGTMEFFLGLTHATSSLFQDSAARGVGTAGRLVVRTTSLDDFFFAEGKAAPDLIKLDIEGAGVYALKVCSKCIQAKRPFFLIESHNPDEDRAISDLICGNNYRGFRLDDRQWVKSPKAIHPDPDGVWGTLFLYPDEMHDRLENIIERAR